MATLVITLTSTPLSGSRTFTASDADVSTLIAYLQAKQALAQDPQGAVTPTPAQALIRWVEDWVNQTLGAARQFNTVHTPPPPLIFT